MNRHIARLPRTISMPIATMSKNVTYRRLVSEADALLKNPLAGCEIAPRDDDIMLWTAVIEGPIGSLYEGGMFFVRLQFADNYPFVPPTVIFLTRIYHCNIDNEGRISLPLTNSGWSPCKNITDILLAISQLLKHCIPTISILSELGEQYLKERGKYEMMAKEWTVRYAH